VHIVITKYFTKHTRKENSPHAQCGRPKKVKILGRSDYHPESAERRAKGGKKTDKYCRVYGLWSSKTLGMFRLVEVSGAKLKRWGRKHPTQRKK